MDGLQILFQAPAPAVVLLVSSPCALLFYCTVTIPQAFAKHAWFLLRNCHVRNSQIWPHGSLGSKSVWYWWEHLYLEQNILGFYLFTLEDFWLGWKPYNSFKFFFCEICSVKQKVVITDSYNHNADSSKAPLDYCRRSNIMTLNYPQTKQPHETGFLH